MVFAVAQDVFLELAGAANHIVLVLDRVPDLSAYEDKDNLFLVAQRGNLAVSFADVTVGNERLAAAVQGVPQIHSSAMCHTEAVAQQEIHIDLVVLQNFSEEALVHLDPQEHWDEDS